MFLPPNVAFSCRRACGRLGTCLRLFPLNGSPLASVIGQLQRLVGDDKYCPVYGTVGLLTTLNTLSVFVEVGIR